MLKILLKIFFNKQWVCLYRKKQKEFSFENLSADNKWFTISCPKRYWCADPFIVKENEKYYVLCEMFDCKKLKGILGTAVLNPSGETIIKPVMDFGCHMSYPNIFKYNGLWYMIPETVERKTIELYKCVQFPNKWEKVTNLLENISAVDTTVFEQANKLYAFIYEPNGSLNSLSIAELDIDNKCFKNITKVKQYTDWIGRPAGNVISYQGNMYRPTQYGAKIYGEKIVFKQFSFNPTNFSYEEKDVHSLSFTDIVSDKNIFKPIGLHTYNSTDDFEIIDIRYNQFTLLKVLYFFMFKLKN